MPTLLCFRQTGYKMPVRGRTRTLHLWTSHSCWYHLSFSSGESSLVPSPSGLKWNGAKGNKGRHRKWCFWQIEQHCPQLKLTFNLGHKVKLYMEYDIVYQHLNMWKHSFIQMSPIFFHWKFFEKLHGCQKCLIMRDVAHAAWNHIRLNISRLLKLNV